MTPTARDWTYSSESNRLFGDTGPWVRHVARAWQAVASHQLDLTPPKDPTAAFVRAREGATPDLSERRDELIAYWSPLLHLLCFGLGWTRPDRGLARWMELGSPIDDAVLAVVHRWWPHERLTEFLAFAAETPTIAAIGQRVAESGNYYSFNAAPLPDIHADRRRHPTWQATWGGGTDPLHLEDHTLTPMLFPERPSDVSPHWPAPVSGRDSSTVPSMVVITDTYIGWHANLWHYQPRRANNGRSIRTTVISKPVGWMGEYRYSTQTGAWFRGRHRWHQLGQ